MKKPLLFLAPLLISFCVQSQNLDNSFGPKTLRYGWVTSFAPVTADRILISGRFSYANGLPANGLAGFKTNGDIDNTFNIGSGPDGNVLFVVPYPEGKFLAGGYFKTFNGVEKHSLVRLNADGSVDNTFTPALSDNVSLYRVAVQSTGKIIAFGDDVVNGFNTRFMKRYNADGSLDDSFTLPTMTLSSYVFDIDVLPDDKLLVGGLFSSYGGVTGADVLVLLDANGVVDHAFSSNIPGGSLSIVRKIKSLADGTMYVLNGNSPIKLKADGTVDDSFAPTNIIDSALGLDVLSDNSLVVITNAGKIERYSNTGDAMYDITVGAGGATLDLINIGNDKLLVTFHQSNPYSSHRVLNADLTTDSEWKPTMFVNVEFDYNVVDGFRILHQPGGKLIIRADADFYTSGDLNDLHPFKNMFKVNANFDFDNTFNYVYTETEASFIQKLLFVDKDGNIFYRGQDANIHKLKPDGSIDATFTLVSAAALDMEQTADGKYVAVASGATFSKGLIVKFDGTGTVDQSINITSEGQMYDIAVASDGKWYIAIKDGNSVNGSTVKALFRMNSDGTLDTSFNPNSNFINLYEIAVVQSQVFSAGRAARGTSFADVYPIERWNASGDPDLELDDAVKGRTGQSFVIKDNYIYVATWSAVGSTQDKQFEVHRMMLTGEHDNSFKPVIYRTANSSNLIESNPDQIVLLDNNSMLVAADRLYHITLPAAPTSAPTNLAAATTGTLDVTLTWVDNDTNESGFDIERAAGNGTDFTLIGYAEADATTFTDDQVEERKSYSYRVKAVNAGGETGYSNVAQSGIVTGVIESESNFSVYPNPVKDLLHVNYSEMIARFSVFQLDGRLIDSASPRSNEFHINMSNYAAGLYVLQIEHAHGKKAIKLFKQ
jgi:uncharacterized delta-60 repeat protein